jgi:hypothetical protein
VLHAIDHAHGGPRADDAAATADDDDEEDVRGVSLLSADGGAQLVTARGGASIDGPGCSCLCTLVECGSGKVRRRLECRTSTAVSACGYCAGAQLLALGGTPPRRLLIRAPPPNTGGHRVLLRPALCLPAVSFCLSRIGTAAPPAGQDGCVIVYDWGAGAAPSTIVYTIWVGAGGDKGGGGGGGGAAAAAVTALALCDAHDLLVIGGADGTVTTVRPPPGAPNPAQPPAPRPPPTRRRLRVCGGSV